jgi:UDPglucose 6-dehydrogenase
VAPARRIAVIGAGYVGLTTAVGLVERGHDVVLVERDEGRLAQLRVGTIPVFEPGLQEAFTEAVTAERLSVAGSPPTDARVSAICVGTPIGQDGRSDLGQLKSALGDLKPVLGQDSVVLIRSTLPVGSARHLSDWLGFRRERIFANPEFLRQGSALADMRHPARIVVGHYPDPDQDAMEIVNEVVVIPEVPMFFVDMAASELIKNGANAFLALKLSFTNELASLCEEVGADVGDVLGALAADPRIGVNYLRPSFGFGGSCLPKELQTLAVAGQSVGLTMHVTTAASLANLASQNRFVDRIAQFVSGLDGRRIGLLGLAFKAETDDIRGSPALHVAGSLLAAGADVRAFDPAAMPNATRELHGLRTVESAEATFDGADAVVVGTEWPAFRDLAFAELRDRMASARIADGRRLLEVAKLRSLGFDVIQVGLGSPA